MVNLLLGKTGSLRYGWRAFFFYLTLLASTGLVFWLFPGTPIDLTIFGAVVLVSWLFLALENRPFHSLGLRLGPSWALAFAKGVALGSGIMAATAALTFATGGFHLARDPAGSAWTLGAGVLLYFVPALNEELAFRGYFFQRLEKSMGSWACLVVMSLLFAGAHWHNPGMVGLTRILAALNIFLAGMLLGLAYLATRSLALPMGIHFGWNWTQGTLLGFGVSGTTAAGYFKPIFLGRPIWLTGGTFGLEASVPCAIVCLIVCLLLGRRVWTRTSESSTVG